MADSPNEPTQGPLQLSGSLRHVPVLLAEVVDALSPRSGETIVDCTAGLGGHASVLAERLGASGTVVLFDLDPGNLAAAEANVRARAPGVRVESQHASFAEAPRRVEKLGLRAGVVLADLGFSSNQMDDSGRGFSFMRDGPLDMRLNPLSPVTAAELVNTMSEKDLERIIREYGEDPSAGRIARKLVQERGLRPISTTKQFAEIVRSAIPAALVHRMSIDPSTRTFQALRIAVNDELGSLEGLLGGIERAAGRVSRGEASWLAAGARIGIISFHSLEDRAVKRCFAGLVEKNKAGLVCKGALEASPSEAAVNPRSRSAKFRVARILPVS